MTESEKFATAIRIITAPPIMVCALILVIYFACKESIFRGIADLVIILAALMLVPALAYAAAKFIPKEAFKGRLEERKLAFIFSFFGYLAAFVYSVASGAEKSYVLIVSTYFFSLVFLTAVNKLSHIRASGHACSLVGPLILLIWFMGIKFLLLCVLIMAGVVWSSLKLKRHTVPDLIAGSVCAALGFSAALGFINVI